MAVINGVMPDEGDRGADRPARIVVKFRPEAGLRAGEPMSASESGQLGEQWSAVVDEFPDADFAMYFTTLGEAEQRELTARTRHATDVLPDLGSYRAAELADRARADELAAALRRMDSVETAYVEAGPVPPPVNASDDPRAVNQGYLDAAPTGIDARWAWSLADGAGARFVDLERGWTLNHEDLVAANMALISGVNQDFFGHGTAVLGEVVGVDNVIGGIGIAPSAPARVVSQWRTPTNYNTADAIVSATLAMQAGDVLLLEAQTTVGTQAFVPVETEQAVFDAILAATTVGIVVVEAAGNGGHNLDTVTDPSGNLVFDRAGPHFRDSGAIMVGAASSTAPHSRLSFSNYGARIDCFAWGENIDTTGDGWMGNLTTSYTTGFGGTSGASPIITGAALIMQSWRRANLGAPYSPSDLRWRLSRTSGNTASANPASDRIGVMPNLRALLEEEINPYKVDRWPAIVAILLGVIQDGGGVVLTPSGPRPVGPLDHVAPNTRDILLGLAATEIATMIGDRDSGIALKREAARIIRAASERLASEA